MSSRNELFPVFLKLNQLDVLIIGGGNVALEKLQAILTNSPGCNITLVAPHVLPIIESYSVDFQLHIVKAKYEKSFLLNRQIVISALNDVKLSEQIRNDAKEIGVLYNAADKPELCDFYLGSIVQKGDLKVAISTNGKSPTLAKRLKEILNHVIPDKIQESLDELYALRNKLKGDFEKKVNDLNKVTKSFSVNDWD